MNITTAEPDGVLPARMYWLKMIPASRRNDRRPVRCAERHRAVQVRQSRTVGSDQAGSELQLLGRRSSIASVTYEFVSEGGTRLAGLKSGKYDLITNLPPQDVDQAPQAAKVQGQEHPVLILDSDEGITKDPNVRLALNLAVDKQAIVDQVFGGFAAVDAGQLLSPSVLGFNDSIDAYPYDAGQGQAVDHRCRRRRPNDSPSSARPGRWLNDRDLVEAVAGYWKEAGLDVKLDILEFGAYLDVLFDRSSRADAIYVSSSTTSSILTVNSPRTTRPVESARRTPMPSCRRSSTRVVRSWIQRLVPTTYKKAVKIAYDGAYFVLLVNNQDLYGLSTRLTWTPRVDSKLLVKEMSVSG